MKKLSIIIPVYNTEFNLLEECLKSCQNNEDIEVIVIDDGSTIEYQNLIEKYQPIYIKTTNKGVSSARNIGLDIANGEYITFLDSDDSIIIIKKVIDLLEKIDILITRYYILKNQTIENYYKYKESKFVDQILLKRDMFVLEFRKIEGLETVWAKFYRRDYLQKNNIKFNERLQRGEDILFNYEAYTKANQIYYINEFCYNYRMTNHSITRSFDTIMDTNTFILLEEFEKLFKKLNINDKNYPYYVFRLIIRLIRKYYVYLPKDEYNNRIDLLFSNIIITQYLKQLDITNMDKYKKELYKLIFIKDKLKLYDYLREVCDKKLLKK